MDMNMNNVHYSYVKYVGPGSYSMNQGWTQTKNKGILRRLRVIQQALCPRPVPTKNS